MDLGYGAVGCSVAQLVLVVRRLAVRKDLLRDLARHPSGGSLLLSEEARKIQEDGLRQKMKDE